MLESIVKEKINVFISSECADERYKIVRMGIKELLENTGMVSVYTYENEGAISIGGERGFLRYIDSADLVIFLIDKAKVISSGVLKEHTRAIELKKRSLYFFCNEHNKNKIELEKEVEEKNLGKYKNINNYSEFVERVYRDVMQDIAIIYKERFWTNNSSIEINSGNIEKTSDIISCNDTKVENIKIEQTNYINKIEKVENATIRTTINKILKEFYYENDNDNNNIEENELDKKCANFLDVILCNKKFDIKEFDLLKKEILKIYKRGNLKKIVDRRLEALKYYFLDDIPECIKILKSILEENMTNIPTWIKNDIAIDLRNIGNILLLNTGIVKDQILGQDYIDKSEESLYYPLIDRYEGSINNYIMSGLIKECYESPYSSTIENISNIYEDLAKCYYVGIINASISHIGLTIDRLINIFYYENIRQQSHKNYKNIIKYLILRQKDKEIKMLLRTYESNTDILNNDDVMNIYYCIKNINLKKRKEISLCILFKYFKYYFNEENYNKISSEIYNGYIALIRSDASFWNEWKYYYETIKNNIERMDHNLISNIIVESFEKGWIRYYSDVFKLIDKIDLERIDLYYFDKIYNFICEIVKDIEIRKDISNINTTIIIFRQKLKDKDRCSNFDLLIKEYLPDFYNTYLLEIRPTRNIIKKEIRRYVETIEKKNIEQGLSNIYIGYAYNEFEILKNIVKYDFDKIAEEEINLLINICIDTLKCEKQLCDFKNSAIQLLIMIVNYYSDKYLLNLNYEKIKSIETKILKGREDSFFAKERRILNKFNINLLYASLNYNPDIVLELNLTLLEFKDIEKIKSLNGILIFLDKINYKKIPKQFLEFLLYYVIRMTNEREQDIKFLAVKCLIELTKSEYKKYALEHLIRMMGCGNSNIRIAIISRLKDINDEKNISFIKYAIDKAKVDNNYLVRKIALDYKKGEN